MTLKSHKNMVTICKCKTKCIAFLKKNRDIAELQLCGNPLPWVDSGKHLGMHFLNKIEGMKHDVMVKRAQFIGRNNELLQEYSFAHPRTKFLMNSIYNSHFSGSPVWDLFSHEAFMLENTWNKSMRLMFDLPLQTHKYLLCLSVKVSTSRSFLSEELSLLPRRLNHQKKICLPLVQIH